MRETNESFFQPIISTLGLGLSLITALLPIITDNILADYFLDKKLGQITSVLAFVLGLAVIWYVIQFLPLLLVNFGKLKNRGRGYNEYFYSLTGKGLIFLMLLVEVILAFVFLTIPSSWWYASIIQSIVYLVFFLFLIAIFSMLLTQTKQAFDFKQQKENFPTTVFETLEKNRLIKPGVEIYENSIMNFQEMNAEGIKGQGLGRKVRVKTISQDEEIIEVVLSFDGREIYKILKKEKSG